MTKLPVDRSYTLTHEWVLTLPDGTVRVGITDHAQEALGDIVYLQLPAVGTKVAAQDDIAVVESVKAAADIYAPVAGEIVSVNDAAVSNPEKVNQDSYAAWLFAIRPADPAAAGKLLTASDYRNSLEND